MQNMETNLRHSVQILAGDIGPRHIFEFKALNQARDYILQTWENQGYLVIPKGYTVVNPLTKESVQVENLEVTIKGSKKPDEILVVGAHYDSVKNSSGGIDTPGADDNASGVAALLELSKALAHLQTSITIKLIAFTNEEPPFFKTPDMGSYVYAKQLREEDAEVIGMISLEMLGFYSQEKGSQRYPFPLLKLIYPSKGNFLAVVTNTEKRSRNLADTLMELIPEHPNLKVRSVKLPTHPLVAKYTRGVGLSDHCAFWANGYPALMVTDTAFFRNPNYHRPEDKVDTLNFPQMAVTTEGIIQSIISLVNR